MSDPLAQVMAGVNPNPPTLTVGVDNTYATPEELALQRQRAKAILAQGSDTSPLKGGIWEGISRVGHGLIGGLEQRRAAEMAQRNQKIDADALAAAMAGGNVDYQKLLASPAYRTVALQGMAQDSRERSARADRSAERAEDRAWRDRQAELQREFQQAQLAETTAARKGMQADAAAARQEAMRLQAEIARGNRVTYRPLSPEEQKQFPGAAQIGSDGKLVYAPTGLTTEKFRPATQDEVKAYGADPAVSWQVNERTNQLSPVGGRGGANANKLSSTEEKEYFEALDNATAGVRAKEALTHALGLSKKAFSGGLANVGSAIVRNTPFSLGKETEAGAVATKELNSVMTEQALGQLKTIFGGNPTEGERKILLDMQASATLSQPEREALITRALDAVDRRTQVESEKARAIAGNNDRYTGRIERIIGKATATYENKPGQEPPRAPAAAPAEKPVAAPVVDLKSNPQAAAIREKFRRGEISREEATRQLQGLR